MHFVLWKLQFPKYNAVVFLSGPSLEPDVGRGSTAMLVAVSVTVFVILVIGGLSIGLLVAMLVCKKSPNEGMIIFAEDKKEISCIPNI